MHCRLGSVTVAAGFPPERWPEFFHVRNPYGLLVMHGLHIFEALELKFTPFKFVLCVDWLSKLASEGCVYFLKFCNIRQPEKVGTVSPSSDTGTTHVTLVAVPRCQLSYIPHVFKRCDLPVLKIIILWEAMCITFYRQNLNTTFNIRFWVFSHGWQPWTQSNTL